MNSVNKSSFAVFFGNRGFFPASLHAEARLQMLQVLEKNGHKTLMLDENATRHGAVETPAEGKIYADFLRQHHGEFDGIILCLPNFGDETRAVEALKDAGVPILIQAYPDELDKMSPEKRRDAFCGKFSIMDVFHQYGVKFTNLQPHTVHPESTRFNEQLDYFDRLCRVVKGMRRLVVGAIGARTTAFKTVRIDEIALQRHGITMETFDLSSVFARMNIIDNNTTAFKEKSKRLQTYTSWERVPAAAFEKLVRLGVVLDEIIDEFNLDALALRCWVEMQEQLGISPCVLLSELNDQGIIAACEVDIGNAITMYALRQASQAPATCLDWNNNYGDEENKCILFHCGPVPQSMMTAKGKVVDHAILAHAVGEGCSYGCNSGRIAPTPFTFGSLLTEAGKLNFFLGEGRFTDDSIPDDFFGCAGVAEIPMLQKTLQTIGYAGHRHHVSLTPGAIAAPVVEAFARYLNYEVTQV